MKKHPSLPLWILFSVPAFLILRILALLMIPPNGDEVVHLHIADDIAHFRSFPVYFYQQEYMGPLESYFLAPFFRWFGFSFWGGRCYYALFYLSFFGLYLWAVRRLFDREVARSLFVLLAVLPFPALFYTTVVGYGEVLTFMMASLTWFLGIASQRRVGVWEPLGLGFLCGLAFWCNPIFSVWLVPMGVSLMWMIREKGKRSVLIAFSLGFLTGLFPLWIHGYQTGMWMSLRGAGASFSKPNDLARILYFFFARMKSFLSFSYPDSLSASVDLGMKLLTLVPFTLFVLSLAALLFYFLRSSKKENPQRKIFFLFMTLPPLTLALLYSSRNLLEDEGMRFFVPLVIPYGFAVSWGLNQLQRPVWRHGVLGILVGILLVGNVVSLKTQFRKTSEFREVVRFLEERDLQFGIADIGISYALNILSHNRITATPVPYRAPYTPVLERVQREGPRFLVLDRRDPRFRERLAVDSSLVKASVAGYDVFYGTSNFLVELATTPEPVLE